ncbi:MAG: hypothetical protein KGO02_08900, partial [Alphaproteobacteria bacterium]|nr:hypothetical protein [Alphaproteobacteria bacterium]
NSGSAAGKPFASKMYIDGSRRLESWVQKLNSKARYERIVYVFSGSSRVEVKFEQSTDGKDWKVTAIGTGKKLR